MKVYSGEYWHEILRRVKRTEAELMDRYAGILHLRTSAMDGTEESYENTEVRHESPAEARTRDEGCAVVWENHPNRIIIDAERNFDDKLDKVLEHATNIVYKTQT
eukprot:UN03266